MILQGWWNYINKRRREKQMKSTTLVTFKELHV